MQMIQDSATVCGLSSPLARSQWLCSKSVRLEFEFQQDRFLFLSFSLTHHSHSQLVDCGCHTCSSVSVEVDLWDF